jgi:hypothetical protein
MFDLIEKVLCNVHSFCFLTKDRYLIKRDIKKKLNQSNMPCVKQLIKQYVT